jgi:hypothetical protein
LPIGCAAILLRNRGYGKTSADKGPEQIGSNMDKNGVKKPILTEKFGRALSRPPLRDRVEALQNAILARPLTGQEADKEFFDQLNGDDQ